MQAYIEEHRETTRLFRYDVSQIPIDYIVEVTNRFKGLDLTDKVPEEPWMEELGAGYYPWGRKESGMTE